MNGPAHYHEAETHLATAAERGGGEPEEERAHLAHAQVHATLALAAATVVSQAGWLAMSPEDMVAWEKAIS